MSLDLAKINDSPHLLDILIQMEDVLDSMDIYVFKNWMKGEVVEGPGVRRYWFDFTLRYPIANMPDPRGAMRLLDRGARVDYNKSTVENDDGSEPGGATHWDIKISIPKKLIADMNAAELDFYDEEIEIEDVQDAQDSGLDDDAGIMADQQSNPFELGSPDEGEEDTGGEQK